MKDYIFIAFLFCGLMALGFLGVAACVKVICWAFGLAFTWKVALGIWVVMLMLQSIFGSGSKS